MKQGTGVQVPVHPILPWPRRIRAHSGKAGIRHNTFSPNWSQVTFTVVEINYQKATFKNGIIKGNIPVLDIQFGNVWTNIDQDTFKNLGLKYGDSLKVIIYRGNAKLYEGSMPFATTFSAVSKGKPLCYLNSLMNISFALNEENFSETFKISSGSEWTVALERIEPVRP
jgi:S-adenosylmethionine hydrolase